MTTQQFNVLEGLLQEKGYLDKYLELRDNVEFRRNID